MGSPIRTPEQAVAWAKSQPSWPKGMCENFTKNAYYGPDVQTADGAAGIALPTALASWNAYPEWQVTDGTKPPLGAKMFFDGVPGDTAGDTQIYVGGNLTRRTDVGTWGTVGTVDWMWMQDVVGHRYLGWKRDVDGYLMFPPPVTATASTGTELLLSKLVQNREAMIPLLIHYVTSKGDQAYLALGPKRAYQVNDRGQRAVMAKLVNAAGGQDGVKMSLLGRNWPVFNENDYAAVKAYYASQA